MKLMNVFKTFARDDSGAVTVDWVVLTAAIVGIGLAVMSIVGPAVRDSGTSIASNVQTSVANASNMFMPSTGGED